MQGTDNIAPELHKFEIGGIYCQLAPIIAKMWQNETIPAEWKTGKIIKLPKIGYLTQCSNWRGINLLKTINKFLAIVLHERPNSVLEHTLRREQAEFQHSRTGTPRADKIHLEEISGAGDRSGRYYLGQIKENRPGQNDAQDCTICAILN